MWCNSVDCVGLRPQHGRIVSADRESSRISASNGTIEHDDRYILFRDQSFADPSCEVPLRDVY